RGYDDVAMFRVRNEREEGGEKRAGVCKRFIHFPVTGDYAASHVRTSRRRKDLTQGTRRAQSSLRRAVVICRLGLRRRGVCVRREIRGRRRRRWRCGRFYRPHRIGGQRRQSHRRRRWKWLPSWWRRRRLWRLREGLWRTPAFRKRPWGHSRRWF